MKLVWEKLLCAKRIRTGKADVSNRNPFEADYDRIVGSSSVRRLQDKAQVFPLQKNDIVRTRLTHSMEVSALARSIGRQVGKRLENKKEFPDINFGREQTEELEALLQTAGLIHDLGNPPFGHYGEDVIRNWYEKLVDEKKQDNDFKYFDGNVQNLRILTKLQTMNDEYGANFTYGTLATIVKYPYSSDHIPEGKKKKYGYYKSEADCMKKIWEETGLCEGVRHPATYLLEAADDIIYTCDDIEDGVKKGYVDWKSTYAKIKSDLKVACEKANKSYDVYADLFGKIDARQPDEAMAEREKILANVRGFRNFVQGHLIRKAVNSFFDNYETIMAGEFGVRELLDCENELMDVLKAVSKDNCYNCNEVLSLEIAGDKVLTSLLDIFYKAVSGDKQPKLNSYEGKLYQLISENYKYVLHVDYSKPIYEKDEKGEPVIKHEKREFEQLSEYDKIQLIIDYISGMTDSYAVSLYKQLVGISIPE